MIKSRISIINKCISLFAVIISLFLSIKYFFLSYLIMFAVSLLFVILSFRIKNNKYLLIASVFFYLSMFFFSMIIDAFMSYRPTYIYDNYYYNNMLDNRVFENYTKEISINDFRVTPAVFQYSGGCATCMDCNEDYAYNYLHRHENVIVNHDDVFPERLTRFYNESIFPEGSFKVYYIEKSVERECGFIISEDKLKICIFSV